LQGKTAIDDLQVRVVVGLDELTACNRQKMEMEMDCVTSTSPSLAMGNAKRLGRRWVQVGGSLVVGWWMMVASGGREKLEELGSGGNQLTIYCVQLGAGGWCLYSTSLLSFTQAPSGQLLAPGFGNFVFHLGSHSLSISISA
jgi:hypothetical protein